VPSSTGTAAGTLGAGGVFVNSVRSAGRISPIRQRNGREKASYRTPLQPFPALAFVASWAIMCPHVAENPKRSVRKVSDSRCHIESNAVAKPMCYRNLRRWLSAGVFISACYIPTFPHHTPDSLIANLVKSCRLQVVPLGVKIWRGSVREVSESEVEP